MLHEPIFIRRDAVYNEFSQSLSIRRLKNDLQDSIIMLYTQ